MKSLFFSFLFVFAIVQVQAQCSIESVKTESYSLRVYNSSGIQNSYQYDGKSLYDYSSCWLVIANTSGNIYVYDGRTSNPIKTVSTNTSAEIKSVKVLGDKVKIEFDGYSSREFDIK